MNPNNIHHNSIDTNRNPSMDAFPELTDPMNLSIEDLEELEDARIAHRLARERSRQQLRREQIISQMLALSFAFLSGMIVCASLFIEGVLRA